MISVPRRHHPCAFTLHRFSSVDSHKPVAAVAGGATDAARARAAVTNALFAGAEPTGRPSKELLVSVGGGGVLLDGNNHGAAGGASGAAAAASGVTGRNTSPRPAPQRNYKLKVGVRFVGS